ncbi:MAG TPA: elongation factor P [Firmicutes bacterium]|nr:elongation factor P [Bacillota bacterium]
MINVTELRPGNYFTHESNLFLVIDIALNKTAMRKMVVKLKVKNMRSGAVTEMSFLGGTAIETVRLDKKQMQFLYDNGTHLVFMDQSSYEQIEIDKEHLEWEKQFLRGDETVEIMSYDDEIIGLSLPSKVALKIIECEPAIRGDTVNKAMKDALLETGLKVRVPLFINEGETIMIRTDDGTYDGRA